MCVVINRYEKDACVAVDDIQRTLASHAPILVPNDFKSVSECINSGTALLDYADNAAITRAVATLEARLGGTSTVSRPSVIARTISNWLPGRSR